MKVKNTSILIISAILLVFCISARAQTESFTYQGRLTDVSVPANGMYDLRFRIHSTLVGENPVTNIFDVDEVAIVNGNFTVELSFGSAVFTGEPRFLEISVKRSSENTGPYTTLNPRQQITSSPYSIRAVNSANAANLGGIAANQYVLTNDPRLDGSNYVQNSTTQQTGVNFNVGGTGTANILDATTQFNLDGDRILAKNGSSIFLGVDSGNNTTGNFNSFFGNEAGSGMTTGGENSFFGYQAGRIVNGDANSFFGSGSGKSATSANDNSFFGTETGSNTINGQGNSFFGARSGFANLGGSNNVFFGTDSGAANTTGNFNTLIGTLTNVGAGNLTFATAIGAGAAVSNSNSVVLGRMADTVRIPGNLDLTGNFTGNVPFIRNTTTQQDGFNFNVGGTGTAGILNAVSQFNLNGERIIASPEGQTNLFVGVNAGAVNSGGNGNAFFGNAAGFRNIGGDNNAFFGTTAGFNNTEGNNNAFFGNSAGYTNSTGNQNAFFGKGAGSLNQTGSSNSFFGFEAGRDTTASNNAFFGSQAGVANTSGNQNAFFGSSAGMTNSLASNSSYFGFEAGKVNRAANNSFFGSQAGAANMLGLNNSFFGRSAGESGNGGSDNSFFGFEAGKVNTANLNTFIGSQAGSSNTSGGANVFVGFLAGRNNNTSSNNTFVGYAAGQANQSGNGNAFFGTETGDSNTSGSSNSFFGKDAGSSNTTGSNNAFFGNNAGYRLNGDQNTVLGAASFCPSAATSLDYVTLIGYDACASANNLQYATAIGSGARVSTSNTIILGRNDGSDRVLTPGYVTLEKTIRIEGTDQNDIFGSADIRGTLNVRTLYSGANTDLCIQIVGIELAGRLANCSSSLRYKNNVSPFTSGLNLVKKLNPIKFNWIETGEEDLGFGAEDVEKVEPLLVTYNKDGQVQGVKYKLITTVLVNAVKEQQEQIDSQLTENNTLKNQVEEQTKQNQELKNQLEDQQKQLDEQKILIEGLRQIVCAENPNAVVCKLKEEKRND